MNLFQSLFKLNPIQSINLILDRTNQIFFPGETIHGRLLVELNQSIDLGCVELSFVGHTKTVVDYSSIASKSIQTNHHQEQHLFGTNSDQLKAEKIVEDFDIFRFLYHFPQFQEQKLFEGNCSLPFQFPVPLNIPSSFCYRNKLQIDYKIIAKIGRQSKELNVEICGLPSIATEKLSIPVYKRCTKKIGLYNAKQLNLQCRIDHAGWTSGSIIPIYCSIDNHSSRKITINGTLKQEIQIIAHNQRQSFVEKIAISDSNIIDANSVNFQCNLSLKLPDRLPVIQNTCRTIEINYFVEIKLDIPFALNLYSQLPLIITNSPMIDGQNGQQTSNALVSRQDAPPIYPYSDHQHTGALQTDQVRPSAPTMMPPSSSIDYNLSIPSTVYPMSQRILHNHNLIYPTLPSKEF